MTAPSAPHVIATPPAAPQLEPIYRAEFTYVWNSLKRLGATERDLPDLTQNVFLAVHQQLPTYDPKRPLRLWLFGIAFRVLSNHRRSGAQQREVFDETAETADSQLAADEQLDARQKRQLVLESLAQLDDDKRVVLVMHDLDGHTMPDIAAELGVGLNTLYSRLRLARAEFIAAAGRLRRARGES
ncbi:MAG: sigma-70 family RNA polymerase sigma factor [Archangium sp.]